MFRNLLNAIVAGLAVVSTSCARDRKIERRDEAIQALNSQNWKKLYTLSSARERSLINLSEERYNDFCEKLELPPIKILSFHIKSDPEPKPYRENWILEIVFGSGKRATFELIERKDIDGDWYVDVGYFPVFLNGSNDSDEKARHLRLRNAIHAVGLNELRLMHPPVTFNEGYFTKH